MFIVYSQCKHQHVTQQSLRECEAISFSSSLVTARLHIISEFFLCWMILTGLSDMINGNILPAKTNLIESRHLKQNSNYMNWIWKFQLKKATYRWKTAPTQYEWIMISDTSDMNNLCSASAHGRLCFFVRNFERWNERRSRNEKKLHRPALQPYTIQTFKLTLMVSL